MADPTQPTPPEADVAAARERLRALGYATARTAKGIRIDVEPGDLFNLDDIRAACAGVPFDVAVMRREADAQLAEPPPAPPAPQPPRAPSWLLPFAPLILKAAAILAAAALGAIGTYLGVPAKEVEKRVEVLVPFLDEFGDKLNRDGVVHDAEANDADARQAQFKTFADTPAGKVGDAELPKFVYGWKAIEKLTGKPTPLKDQNPTGSCVGFGNTTGTEHTLAAEILARNGDPAEFAFFSEEVTYAAGKVQGAKALGASVSRQDGSATVFVKAWFANGGGMVPKGKYGAHDLTKYDAGRAKSWNLSGPPAELLAVAKKYPVKDSAKITSWEQAKKAMASGYFPAVDATWSYSRQRDANGVAQPTREGWNHCMALTGYYVDPKTGKEYGHVENSWSAIPGVGPYHTGPTGWGEPTTAGFWAESTGLERAIKQGGTYAHSGVTGFPARKIDWFVLAEPARPAPLWKVRHDLMARDRFALAW